MCQVYNNYVDGISGWEKAWALQGRLGSGRLSFFSKGESGSPQIQTGLPEPLPTRPNQGLRFPQCTPPCKASPDLLICCLAVFIPPLQPFQLLEGIPKTPLSSSHADLGMCYPRKVLGHCFAWLPTIPFPPDLQLCNSSLLLVLSLGSLSSTAVHKGLAMSVLCQGWRVCLLLQA